MASNETVTNKDVVIGCLNFIALIASFFACAFVIYWLAYGQLSNTPTHELEAELLRRYDKRKADYQKEVRLEEMRHQLMKSEARHGKAK